MMDIFKISFEDWQIFSITVNWLIIFVIIAILLMIIWLLRKVIRLFGKNSITVDEATLGIGDSNIIIRFDRRDQEIAYKLWIELSTRKIGILYDEDNDVIKEVYDSWYTFFGISRELLKEIPANRLPYCEELIDLTQRVLNEGIRPHLTKWQAKYRKWYDEKFSIEKNKTPQEIQKEYPEYSALIRDLLETNKRMIEYKNLMKKIAFDYKGDINLNKKRSVKDN